MWQADILEGAASSGHNCLDELRRETASKATQVFAWIDDTWVADAETHLLGFVVVRGDQIVWVAASHELRGSGVGDELMRHAVTVIAESGHDTAWVGLAASDVREREWCVRNGWRDAGEIPAPAGGYGPRGPLRRYEKTLNER